jgi:hypothetical protein
VEERGKENKTRREGRKEHFFDDVIITHNDHIPRGVLHE